MKKTLLGIALLALVLPAQVLAQEMPLQDFYVGVVTHVDEGAEVEEDFLVEGALPVKQRMLVVELDADIEPRIAEVIFDETLVTKASQIPRVGDRVVVSRDPNFASQPFIYVDQYRLPSLVWLAALFVVLVVAVAGRRGVAAVAGLLASVVVIFGFVAPRLMHGASPVMITLIGSVAIVVASMGLAHGFSKRTGVAMAAVLVSLLVTVGLGALGVAFTELLGYGDEAAVHIRLSALPLEDLTGLLLAAIIIGTLGVVDDVSITQVTVVKELHDADASLSGNELFRRAHNVGKEHIAAVVNTLVLAYVGAALPLFVLLYANTIQPAWVLLNGETLGEEIVRTVIGSMGLVLAVPISTFLAVRFFTSSQQMQQHEGEGSES